MLDLLFELIVIVDAIVIINICVCVGNKMTKKTCDRMRWAYVTICGAAVGAIGMTIFIRPPTFIETLTLTGLAALFLFDRRNYYGSDNEDGMQDMQMAEKDSKA